MENKNNNLKLFYSMVSGDMYYVEEDEVKNLDQSQIPLIKKPSSSCKKCYGRFYMGKDTIKNYYIPCSTCMKKCIDWSVFKEQDIELHTPKTLDEIADNEFNKALEGLEGVSIK